MVLQIDLCSETADHGAEQRGSLPDPALPLTGGGFQSALSLTLASQEHQTRIDSALAAAKTALSPDWGSYPASLSPTALSLEAGSSLAALTAARSQGALSQDALSPADSCH